MKDEKSKIIEGNLTSMKEVVVSALPFLEFSMIANKCLEEAYEKLNEINTLLYLEALCVSDEFNEKQREFIDLDLSGSVKTKVTRSDVGSVIMSFHIEDSDSSEISPLVPVNGYEPAAFNFAAHDQERELCVRTEEKYRSIRKYNTEVLELMDLIEANF